MERLRQGNAPGRGGVYDLLQILALPSFEAVIAWDICEDTLAEASYFAVKTMWHQEIDADKMETPVVRLSKPRQLEPTFEVQQFSLPTDWTEATIAELKNLSIAPMIDYDMIGCDGVSYEVKFDAGFAEARYHWWEEPPAGWLPLYHWTMKTLEYLNKLEPEKQEMDK